MKPKTVYCEWCQFREYVGDDGLRCTKGHKPRFYQRTYVNHSDEGWKRRCADFVTGDHVIKVKL